MMALKNTIQLVLGIALIGASMDMAMGLVSAAGFLAGACLVLAGLAGILARPAYLVASCRRARRT